MNKLPLSHRAKRSQIHATALAPCAPYRTNHTSVDTERARFSGHDRTHACHANSPRAAIRTTVRSRWHPRALSQSRAEGCSRLRLRPMAYDKLSGVRGEVRAGRRERAQRAAGLSGATEAAKDRACARATEDLWPLAGAGSGHVARAYLQRPTLRNTCRAPLGDHVSSMLDGDLEAVVGGAKWCSTCDNRKWASSVHAFERALPAGRAGSGCCSELPADLLSS